MYYKRMLIALLILAVVMSCTQAQAGGEATDKGAALIEGAFALANQSGDVYYDVTAVAFTPSLLFFSAPGIGIGGDLMVDYLSIEGNSVTNWGVGPKIGFYFESDNSNAIPFLTGGFNFLTLDDEAGMRFKFGGGMLVRKDHLAVTFGGTYMIDRFSVSGDTRTGSVFLLEVGFAGLLY